MNFDNKDINEEDLKELGVKHLFLILNNKLNSFIFQYEKDKKEADYDKRLRDVELYIASEKGIKSGIGQNKNNFTWTIGILVGLLSIASIVIALLK